jgi:hypothetical protein
MTAHDLDRLLGEITGVELQLRILVLSQNRKRRVARTSSYFKDGDGPGVLPSDLIQNRELLLEPFPVLEEVGRVVLVELVPPFGRI